MCKHFVNSGVSSKMWDIVLMQADILVASLGSKQRFVKGSPSSVLTPLRKLPCPGVVSSP